MPQHNELSNREREVTNLLLEGKSNKQIAAALGITVRTVEFHLKNIYEKLQVSSRVELVLKLGSSTVADKGEVAENRDRPNVWMRWATSLREAVSKIGKELSMASQLNTSAHDPGIPLTFYGAIRVCLAKYAEFTGRATRPEFWWFALFVTLVTQALTYLSQALGGVFLIAMLLPLLAAGARRLRDSGTSAWWQLFLLAPIAGIIVLGILWAQPSTSPRPEETLSA